MSTNKPSNAKTLHPILYMPREDRLKSLLQSFGASPNDEFVITGTGEVLTHPDLLSTQSPFKPSLNDWIAPHVRNEINTIGSLPRSALALLATGIFFIGIAFVCVIQYLRVKLSAPNIQNRTPRSNNISVHPKKQKFDPDGISPDRALVVASSDEPPIVNTPQVTDTNDFSTTISETIATETHQRARAISIIDLDIKEPELYEELVVSSKCSSLRQVPPCTIAASSSETTLTQHLYLQEDMQTFAHILCEYTSVIDSTMAANGVRLEAKESAQLAFQRISMCEERQDKQNVEMRHYYFEHQQREMDRKQKNELHEQSINAAQEAKDWLAQLTAARSRCFEKCKHDLSCCAVAVVCCPLGLLTLNHIRSIYRGGIWGIFTLILDMIPAKCSAPPTPTSQSYFLSLLGPAAYYVPTIPSTDEINCYVTRIAIAGALAFFALRWKALPSSVKIIVLVLGFISYPSSKPIMIVTVTITSVCVLSILIAVAWIFVKINYRSLKNSFKESGRNPSSFQLNSSLESFDEIASWSCLLGATTILISFGLMGYSYFF